MRRTKDLRSIIRQKTRTFCNHCTLHGIYYVNDRHHWLVYTVWSIIIVLSVVLCAILSHMIWQKFVVDPTFTVVQSTRYPTGNIAFPLVSVCDTEPVYGPSTTHITHILRSRGYNFSEIGAFYRGFSEVKKKDYIADATLKKMHSLLQDLGLSFIKLMDVLKKPCDVLITRCAWRSRPYNCTEMFRQVYTIAGYCCQFDMDYFTLHAEEGTNFVAGIEPTEALDIIVDGQKVSHSGTVTDGYVTLYVVDAQNSVTLLDNAITLTPGGYFDVNVYLWAIDSSDDVKALSIQNRQCLLDTDKVDVPDYYHGCMTTLILRKTVNYCRCLPFKFTAKELVVDEYAPCTWERLVCIYQTLDKIQGDIRGVTSQSKCLQKCDYVHYDTEIEYVRQQRLPSERNNISKVVVHFSSKTCLKYRREVLYTWDQLLANLGGIFGLCLGGSIISLMELIWFLVDLLVTILTSAGKKTVTPYKENKVFTLTENDLVTKVHGKHSKEKTGRLRFVH